MDHITLFNIVNSLLNIKIERFYMTFKVSDFYTTSECLGTMGHMVSISVGAEQLSL